MSIFDTLGLDDPSIVDPTAGLPPGQYLAFLSDCKVTPNKKDASKNNIQFTFKVADENSPYKGKTVSEWKSANPGDDPQTKGFLKARLKSLGYQNGQKPQDLIGVKVAIKVVEKDGYTNVREVVLLDESGTVVPTGPVGTVPSGGDDW